MNVTAIDHVNLAVPAERTDEAVAFYLDTLGFDTDDTDPATALDEGLLRIRLGPENLLFLRSVPSFDPPEGDNWDHVAFRVSETAESLESRFEAADVSIIDVATRRGATGTFQSVYVADPFGYTLEFKAVGE